MKKIKAKGIALIPDGINVSLSYKDVCELSKESYDLKDVKTVMDKHKAGFVYFN